MSNSQQPVTDSMRPNIQISHAKNGRVKDFAAANGITTQEAYDLIIDAGLEALQQDGEGAVADDSAGEDNDEEDDAAALAGWSHGRTDEEQQASQRVAEQGLTWLREYGEIARKSDVPLAEFDDPLGRDADTLWTQVIRSSWQHCVEAGLVEMPHSRGYRWVGKEE